jgi:transposase
LAVSTPTSTPADVARPRRQRTHDYVRHGTTTLFAALEIATGKVAGVCKNRHRHQEFLASSTTSWFSNIEREAIHRGSFPPSETS